MRLRATCLERPALVFNDGSDTYFQPRAGQKLRVDGGHVKVRTSSSQARPEVIHYTASGSGATAYWKKANRFIGDKARSDTPSDFAGFSGRLALIGARSRLESTRPISATLPLSQLVKALVPQGWTGSAQKDIDLTTSANFSTRDGENWMQSLDRLIAGSDLYADVDFNAHHVSVRRPPKSVAVNYVASAAPVVTARLASASNRPDRRDCNEKRGKSGAPRVMCSRRSLVLSRSVMATTVTYRSVRCKARERTEDRRRGR